MKKLIFSFYIFAFGCLLLSCEEQDNFGIDQADKAFNLEWRLIRIRLTSRLGIRKSILLSIRIPKLLIM